MNFPFYLAKRITVSGQRTFSKLIVRVAVTTIAVGVAAMILAIAVLNGFKQEVSGKQRGFFGDVLIAGLYNGHAIEQEPVQLLPDRMATLHSLPEVQEIRKYATKPGIINVNGEVEGVVLKGIDGDYNQDFLSQTLIAGQVLDFADSTKALTQVLISEYTARRLELQVGDDFIMFFVQEPIRRRKFTIQGIYNTSAEELDKTYVIGALPLIARLNDWSENEVGGYEVVTNNFEQVDELTQKLAALLPMNFEAVSLRSRFPEIFQWLDLLDANPQIILALMMIVAIINMISALLIIILERTQMIGLLKAFGFADRGLRQVFLYYSAYLVGLGLLIGNVLAGLIYVLQKYTRFIKLDEASYFVSYVPVEISWVEVGLLNIGVLVIALAVLLLPSYLIGKVNPVRTIHFR